MKGALQGEEQPARTGLFLLVWVWAAEKAVQGGGMEENRPLLHQEPNIWVQDSGGGWR